MEVESGSRRSALLLWGERRPDLNENCLYFVSVILDVWLLKESVLAIGESDTLKALLDNLLNWIGEEPIITETAIKIIKILYQHLIFQDGELLELGQRYPTLEVSVRRVIEEEN